ncbi:MAG: hypothetical protein JST75_03410 [Bacteroidetes bacterium]|nr:hypothetical protein [Bacteroidota bacterium]
MIRRPLLISFVSCFLLYQSKAQTLDATLKTYADQYEQEKIHIHFDKDAYLPGETIWMKAYILSGSKPSTLSKNIYFDWTDINGNILSHSVSPVMEGVSTSSFTLPPGFAIVGNAVHVKAYTQWMLNFDSSFLFNKNIAVLTSWDGSVRPDKHAVNIQFFPEGGDMINGMASALAFEATDQRGRPVEVKGVIKKNNDEIVDSFATAHEGMGFVKFVPHSNETYTAYWKDEFGDAHTSNLPPVKPTGAAMRVNNARDNSIHFQLERALDAGDNYKSLTIIVTSHQQVVYKSTVDLSTKMNADGTIPTRSIPDGIVQITVFDAKMVPFAERIVFVNNYQYRFTAQVKKEVVNLNKRGRNEISIEVPDSLSATLSVSITDGGMGYDTASNIITDLLLSSDLKGNIVNPAYYFTGNPDTANAHLDLLMRTHGWRRFNWEEAVAGRFPSIQFPADNDYMSIKGRVDPAQSSFDASDSIALLVMTRDRKKHILNLPLNANGTFGQKGIFFYDSLQVLYQINHVNKIKSSGAISLQTNLMPASLSNVRATEPVFQWNRVPDVILEKESNGLITEDHNYSRASTGMNYVFSPVIAKNDQSKIGSETASHYLQSNFPDLKFPYGTIESNTSNNQDSRYVSYVVNTGSTPTSTVPAPKNNVNVQLDGVQVTMDDLKQVSMKEVLFIKFLQKTNPKDLPTLAITSRLSIYENNIINNKTGYAVVAGYTPAREFYSPQYTETPIDIAATDFRSTIYWNPRVVVDKNNRKIKLVFYNNDITNKFRIVVEGMNKDGKLTRIEEVIK